MPQHCYASHWAKARKTVVYWTNKQKLPLPILSSPSPAKPMPLVLRSLNRVYIRLATNNVWATTCSQCRLLPTRDKPRKAHRQIRCLQETTLRACQAFSSQEALSQLRARNLVGNEARYTDWRLSRGGSSRSIKICNIRPLKTKHGFASSANTRAYSAKSRRHLCGLTRSRTEKSDGGLQRSADCWRRPS